MGERQGAPSQRQAPRGGLLNRRHFLAGAGALVGVSAFEGARLKGKFDWRSLAGPQAKARWEASLALPGDGMVHLAHSTHLLQVGGLRLLTDPWFYDPAYGAMSHEVAPAVAPEDVGPLDVLLVTHRHPDHFDRNAVDKLDKRALVVVNEAGLAEKARAMGFSEIEVLAEWRSIEVRGVTITGVPAVHDIEELGYVVQSAGTSVYFAGDTRLHDDLERIRDEFAPQVAILPVDGTLLTGGQKWVMTPDDAVVAAKRLGVKLAMPSHAEAWFSDPLVAAALATTIAGAPAVFVEAMRGTGITALAPAPGERVAFETAG